MSRREQCVNCGVERMPEYRLIYKEQTWCNACYADYPLRMYIKLIEAKRRNEPNDKLYSILTDVLEILNSETKEKYKEIVYQMYMTLERTSYELRKSSVSKRTAKGDDK